MSSAEMPLLVIGWGWEDHGRQLRVVAPMLWSIENNLSAVNMDFEEFADSADEDGVFRDFP
jgi:hypothetical protein